ncbi:hypothetical protein KDX01_28780 [Burkholderia vietnamiensis]|nr:hypothetical protein [Burkholderia vietnamiensis]MBR7977097.1 hypothetical protein [Burkholderia vietnamiensis]
MQREALRAACRPDDPVAPRAARISIQTQATTATCRSRCSGSRNRTTSHTADRLDGPSSERRAAPAHTHLPMLRDCASPHRRAPGAVVRACHDDRFAPLARILSPRFRIRIPSRGRDACLLLHAVFADATHPAPRRVAHAAPTRPATLAERARAA